MHTLLQSHMANALAHSLQEAERPADRTGSADAPSTEPVLIRRAVRRDLEALRSLADLDGTRSTRVALQGALDDGGVLLAEVGGAVRAALPLDGGRAVADPFVPTAGVTELLALRAGQLRRAA